ncbi:MAG: aminopeptidase [Comamonadaceae bacterium]|nr:MAG: aminopeptidase [Comamonadaceae bacterium]
MPLLNHGSRALRLLAACTLAAAVALAIGGCAGTSSVSYYWQSVTGHLQMVNAARPIQDWLGDAETPARLKARLALSQQVRAFAVSELKLPDNASYHRYADLHRTAVVWNVVAAPEFSLTLKNWCFPIAGCVGYRGYFDEKSARDEAAQLKAQGFETSVYGVPAYSTLGWMNWAGGDPLLSTFINYPEGELARMVFHELSHQVVYVSGDTMFNESFATAVERLGSARWLAERAGMHAQQEYGAFDTRRQQFRALMLQTRRELEAVYKEGPDAAKQRKANGDGLAGADPAAQAIQKAEAMQRFRERYAALKASWNGFSGYDSYVANANNASLGAQAAYDQLVPGFEALFEREGRDWQRFYDAVKQISQLSKSERRQQLEALAKAYPHT